MIGILTFQDTTNYGAILQTYALNRKITSLGFENEVINYHCDYVYENEHPRKILQQRSLKGILRCIVTNRALKNRVRKFHEFSEKYIRISEREYDQSSIAQSNSVYDRFIVGSDQVWNLELNGYDYTFFLDFVSNNAKKNSYATSFGYENIIGDIEKQKELLSQFFNLNVREQKGQQIIRKLTGLEADVVLDPTFLLAPSEWDEVASQKIFSQNYIFVYLINRSKANFRFIRHFAKKHGCKVLYLHNYIKSQPGFVNIRDASPEEFISYVKHAKFVFTGSYHCVCFSLIYHKQVFYTLENHTGRNSRLTYLLNLVHLEDRLLLDGKVQNQTPIDYSSVNKIIEEQLHFSNRKLLTLLEEE
jgi:hypothetical protein